MADRGLHCKNISFASFHCRIDIKEGIYIIKLLQMKGWKFRLEICLLWSKNNTFKLYLIDHMNVKSVNQSLFFAFDFKGFQTQFDPFFVNEVIRVTKSVQKNVLSHVILLVFDKDFNQISPNSKSQKNFCSIFAENFAALPRQSVISY